MQPFLHQKCLSWFKVQRSRETLLVLDQVLPRCRGWDVMSRRKTGKNSRDICIELDGCRASKLRRETYSRARWWGSACGKICLVIQHRKQNVRLHRSRDRLCSHQPICEVDSSASFAASPAPRASAMAVRPSVAVFNPSPAVLTAVSSRSSDLLHRFGSRREVGSSLNASNVIHDGRIRSACH